MSSENTCGSHGLEALNCTPFNEMNRSAQSIAEINKYLLYVDKNDKIKLFFAQTSLNQNEWLLAKTNTAVQEKRCLPTCKQIVVWEMKWQVKVTKISSTPLFSLNIL